MRSYKTLQNSVMHVIFGNLAILSIPAAIHCNKNAGQKLAKGRVMNCRNMLYSASYIISLIVILIEHTNKYSSASSNFEKKKGTCIWVARPLAFQDMRMMQVDCGPGTLVSEPTSGQGQMHRQRMVLLNFYTTNNEAKDGHQQLCPMLESNLSRIFSA